MRSTATGSLGATGILTPTEVGTASARTGLIASGTQITGAPPSPSSTVTLPTGEQVRLDVLPDGQDAVASAGLAVADPVSPSGAQFTGFTWDGDKYVIPVEAVPYVGSVLDPSLFDVSYLARSHLDNAHASGLPVRITYAGGRAPSLPGVNLTHASDGTAVGTITHAQAPKLGQFLAAQLQARRAGQPVAGPDLLSGVIHISLVPPTSAPVLPSDPFQASAGPSGGSGSGGFAFHTLTVHLTDLNGSPAQAAVGIVQNVDDLGLLTVAAGTTSGSYSVSVPEGDYSIAFTILTPDSPSSLTPFRAALVIKPQVVVDGDETLTLDARTAKPYSAALNAATPGATERYDLISFTRTSVTGGTEGSQDLFPDMFLIGLSPVTENPLAATELLATPTKPVTKGALDFDAASALYDPAPSASDSPPRYYFVFPHPGSIPASLDYTVPQARLTTVHEHIYTEPPPYAASQELWPDVYLPWGDAEELGTSSEDNGTSVFPGEHTDYWYSSAPRLTVWQGSYNNGICQGSVCGERIWGQRWVIHPRQQISETWNKAPAAVPPVAHPSQTYAELGGDVGPVTNGLRTVCPACRQGNVGMLYLSPPADSSPSQYLDADAGSPVLSFYRNGTLVIDSASLPQPSGLQMLYPFGLELPLADQPATYQLDWTSYNGATGVGHSNLEPSTTTDWSFRSDPAGPARLPKSEECSPDPSQACSFLPLLYLTYDLHLNSMSQAPGNSPFTIAFSVGYQPGEEAPRGVTATVSVSFDDGQTWTSPQAATPRRGNEFAAAIRQPAVSDTSGFVSLRVTATDSSGSSVTQTIIRAYGLTS